MRWWTKHITEEQQQAYQQQINWKYPDRTVLKSWAIEVKDYDTSDYYAEAIMLPIPILCSVVMFFLFRESNAGWFQWPAVIACLGVLLPGLWLVLTILNQKKLLVYRLTNEGFEVAGWNSQAEGQKKLFIGAGIVCSIIALCIVLLVPQAFILLFIGPGCIVVATLSQSANQQAWELQKDYSQKEFEWGEFEKIGLFKQRQVITFYFDKPKRIDKTGRHILFGRFHVFCTIECYSDIIIFIKQRLQNIPCAEELVKLYPSACS